MGCTERKLTTCGVKGSSSNGVVLKVFATRTVFSLTLLQSLELEELGQLLAVILDPVGPCDLQAEPQRVVVGFGQHVGREALRRLPSTKTEGL